MDMTAVSQDKENALARRRVVTLAGALSDKKKIG